MAAADSTTAAGGKADCSPLHNHMYKFTQREEGGGGEVKRLRERETEGERSKRPPGKERQTIDERLPLAVKCWSATALALFVDRSSLVMLQQVMSTVAYTVSPEAASRMNHDKKSMSLFLASHAWLENFYNLFWPIGAHSTLQCMNFSATVTLRSGTLYQVSHTCGCSNIPSTHMYSILHTNILNHCLCSRKKTKPILTIK